MDFLLNSGIVEKGNELRMLPLWRYHNQHCFAAQILRLCEILSILAVIISRLKFGVVYLLEWIAEEAIIEGTGN